MIHLLLKKKIVTALIYIVTCFLLIACSISPSYAQLIDIELYGLQFIEGEEGLNFVNYDPGIQSLTLIENYPDIGNVQHGSSAFNHEAEHYFFTTHSDDFLPHVHQVSAVTGEILNDPLTANFNMINNAFDLQHNIMYGLNFGGEEANPLQLVSYNFEEGISTVIAAYDIPILTGNSLAYNSNSGTLYFSGYPTLTDPVLHFYSISAITGEIISDIIVDIETGYSLSEPYVALTNNLIYGIGHSPDGPGYHFMSYDPVTHLSTTLAPIGALAYQGGSPCFDQASRTYVFIGYGTDWVQRLYLINADDGSIISNDPLDVALIEIECNNNRFAKEFYNPIGIEGDIVLGPDIKTMANINNTITINVPPNAKGAFSIVIFNQNGHVLYIDKKSKQELINNRFIDISIDKLKMGTYFVVTEYNGQKQAKAFFKR